jgi:hypothetical protein
MQKSIFLLLLLFSFACVLSAQSVIKKDTTKIDILVFENLERGQLRFIRQGGHVQYALNSSAKQKMSGTLERIDTDSITVGSNTIALNQLAYLKGRVRSERDITGGLLVGIGVTTTALGTAFISSTVGAVVLAGGITSLVVGIHLITAKRKFNFNKGWQAYGGTIEYCR